MTISETVDLSTQLDYIDLTLSTQNTLTLDDSLYQLINSDQSEEFLKENRLTYRYRDIKKMITSDVHEDALKAFPIRLMKGYYSEEYLKSDYSKLTDEEFVEMNSFDEDLVYSRFFGKSNMIPYISSRLNFIESHKLSIIHQENTDYVVNIKKAIKEHFLTLRDVRSLQSEKDIKKIFNYSKSNKFSKKSHSLLARFSVSLLSHDQQLAIKGKELFKAVIGINEKDELEQMLQKMDPIVLHKRILKMGGAFHNLPHTVLPILDFTKLSDGQFADFVEYDTIGKLGNVQMDEDKLESFVRRIIHLTTVKKKVTKKFENGEYKITTMVPRVHVRKLEEIPGKVFKIIKFSELTKDEVFNIFHRGTIKHIEKTGEVFIRKKNVLWKYTLDYDRGYLGTTYSEKGLRKWRKKYNKHRLSLLMEEQYESFRDKLHKSIRKIGDAIHRKSENT